MIHPYSKRFFSIVPFCFILLLCICCNKVSDKVLSFQVGSEYEFAGLVKYGDENCLCFIKKHFRPNVKIFDINGVLKDSISLAIAEKELENISDVWVISADTICVYSNYNGILMVLNSEGAPVFQKSYYDITDENGYHYDLLPSHPLYPFTTNERSDVVFSTWMWSGEIAQSPKERLDDVRNGYLMCKINPFIGGESENDFMFGMKYSDITELSDISRESVFFIPGYMTHIVNNKFIVSSFYSRYIYELSDSLSVKRAVKILDNNSSIIQPIPIDSKGSIQDKANKTMDDCLRSTFVSNMLYNEITGKYLILIKNGISDGLECFPFKIRLYDNDFNKVKEIEIDNYRFVSRKSFIMDGDLYIELKNESHNTKVYECIKI